MGGEIGIESAPGAGSTFWFTGRFEKQLTLSTTTATKAVGNLSGARVLIVDDNATNRKILIHQTGSWGMIAAEAKTGERALELLRAAVNRGEPYDIAVLDLMMPDMDGFQLAGAIKSDCTIASVALVLLPSFGKRGHGEAARAAGIAAYLQKPVRQSQLYKCLTEVLARSNGEAVTAPQLVTRHSMRESRLQQNDQIFSSVRILIAEDNLVNQKVALGQLSNLGYCGKAFPNGRELLKALEKSHVDIILMDCQMPVMDGFAATAEIRRREGTARHTTIIAMTANALDGDNERCLAAGMDDYLSKPVKPDALRLKLEKWIKPADPGKGLSESSEPAHDNRGSVIDQAHLASLREIKQPGVDDFLTELIDLFFDDTPAHLKALNEAIKRDDSAETVRLAHSLKGSSANMGATQMASVIEELENKDPAKNASQIMARVEQEFELVREALKAERQGIKK
jgi:CheY-like chemotaxis protein